MREVAWCVGGVVPVADVARVRGVERRIDVNGDGGVASGACGGREGRGATAVNKVNNAVYAVEQLILLAGMVVAAASGRRAGIDEVDEDRYTLR